MMEASPATAAVSAKRRAVLITGASAGLGRGMAWEFARRGRDLALCARRLDALAEVRAAIIAAHPGVRVAIRQLDVNDHDRVFQVFGELAAELGGIDRIVVNAGSRAGAPVGSGGFEVNRHAMQTNLVAALAQCEAGLGLLRARGTGHLVVISSVSALRGFPGHLTAYAASKAGLLALAEGIRADTMGTPIRVTTVLPGYIWTGTTPPPGSRLVTGYERGCRLLVRAIERERARVIVPGWPWLALAGGLRILPLRITRRFGGTAQRVRAELPAAEASRRPS